MLFSFLGLFGVWGDGWVYLAYVVFVGARFWGYLLSLGYAETLSAM